jgi:hypothetical protein
MAESTKTCEYCLGTGFLDIEKAYKNWRPDFYLYVFFNQDSGRNKFHQLEKSIAGSSGKVALAKLEWNSISAYKPKIRYKINTLEQCALTNSWGGMIVRLRIPKDISELSTMLDSLGYKREAKLIMNSDVS